MSGVAPVGSTRAFRRGSVLAAILDPRTRVWLLVAGVAAMLMAVVVVGLPSPQRVRDILSTGGPWTPVLAVAGIAVLAVLVFPRAGIAVLAGLVFGPWTATVYILLGTMIGAAAAFGIGRLLGREYLAQLLSGRPEGSRLARLDGWLGRRALLAVVSARLLPVVPFGLLNYGFGTTRVSLVTFLAGTAAGILPSTVLYAAVGSAASDPTSPLFVGSAALTVVLVAGGAIAVRSVHRSGASGDERPGCRHRHT